MSILFLLASAGWADSLIVELPVPTSPPPTLDGAPVTAVYSRYLGERPEPDVTVQSSHPNIKCSIYESQLKIHFTANTDAWPALPISAECTHGEDTLVVNTIEPTLEQFGGNSADTTEIGVDQAIHFYRSGFDEQLRTYRLPSNLGFRAGAYPSTLSRVKCIVKRMNGGPVVQVQTARTGALGTGTCSLPTVGEEDYVLNLSIEPIPT